MRKILVIIAVILIALSVPGSSPAYDWNKEQYEFGVKLGMIFEGEVYMDPPDQYFDTDAGFMFALRADAVVTPKMSAGVFLHQISNATGAGDEMTTTAIGGSLKVRLTMSPDLQLRPGLTIGYNMICGDAFQEDATGLELGAFLEAALHLQDGHMVTGELGFVSQPAGGNSDIDMTYGPTFYLLAGYAFGK